ncbi:Zn-ribbon domain-containing OB-fold protein [Variovorax sp. RA8]|uniref:Zn-ribbon domain-containing OB-fold protein n=1 Tax=Variovorax sp. (strain JCM 16519 / RA8) TaxID=662548 RepID=UPI001E4EE356|nr:OB-fold domain-containing protein [Variovorax sp. RA8]
MMMDIADTTNANAGTGESPRGIFLASLAQGRLAYQFDRAAGRAVFPPQGVGPGGDPHALEWRTSRGAGTVYACTEVQRRDARFNIALVDLDEGFRMMSTVVDAPPGALRTGLRVLARIEPWGDAHRVVFGAVA